MLKGPLQRKPGFVCLFVGLVSQKNEKGVKQDEVEVCSFLGMMAVPKMMAGPHTLQFQIPPPGFWV